MKKNLTILPQVEALFSALSEVIELSQKPCALDVIAAEAEKEVDNYPSENFVSGNPGLLVDAISDELLRALRRDPERKLLSTALYRALAVHSLEVSKDSLSKFVADEKDNCD